MTAIDRLITNVNSVIYFLKAFSDPAPQDVTFTWINDDDTTTDITYANIKKFQDQINDTLSGNGSATTNIIQHKIKTFDVTNHIVISGVHPPQFVKIDDSYQISITPKRADSILRLTFSFLVGGRNSSNIMSFKFYDETNNKNVGFSTLGTGSHRTFCNASLRTKDHDANDRDYITMEAYQPSENTNERTYGIYASKEGNSAIDINMTITDNAGCSYAPPILTVQEIIVDN